MLAALALLVAGCAPAPVSRTPVIHPTIVSLNPCTDAILAELAGPRQVLALSHYSRDPRASSMNVATARRFATTGGTVEEVLALDPDIVVGGSFMPPATRAAFARLGIKVETFGIASSVAESEAQVRRLAVLAGHRAQGEALVRRIDTAVERAHWSGKPASAILWQPDGIVPGKRALVTRLMANAGLSSQSAARGMGQADYLSLERLLADPPQVLLVAGNQRGQHHPALRDLHGVIEAKFDPALLFCGGPTIIRAADRLAEIRREES
ncbi:ABC transporter substrate-binding protein [Tsuneonella mangrovi]|uniref:ABC transporter substrate-binding protein n=1 Tax=Tsuneonella mangrovi TaxID=1982042 RepID=UPI001F0A5AEA|nr:ABC transporter substrate-binding protein [Tsuneonella mangrovi]